MIPRLFWYSIKQETTYRINFIMSHVRSVLQFLVVFFLWQTIFSHNQQLFGYQYQQMMGYLFLMIIVRAMVLSSKSSEIAGEISRGDLSNYLIKPIKYLKYWFVRDISVKFLNFSLSIIEVYLIWLLLKTPLGLSLTPLNIIAFLLALLMAIILYFLLSLIFSSVTFWAPESAWGMNFFLIVLLEFLSGSVFPLDILPGWLQLVVSFTPFKYLIFQPLQIIIGKLAIYEIVWGYGVTIFWIILFWFIVKDIWKKGLIQYEASGR